MKRRRFLKSLGLFGLGAVSGGGAMAASRDLRSLAGRGKRAVQGWIAPPEFDLAPRAPMPETQWTRQPAPFGFAAPAIKTVRIGLVGAGAQGRTLARLLYRVDNAQLTAVCDIAPDHIDMLRRLVAEDGFAPAFKTFDGTARGFGQFLEADFDLVLIATPWEDHAPMAVAAMQAGKHVAVEVPLCVTVDEAWQLLETHRATGRHCVMLENVCYMRPEQMVMNLARAGLLGDLRRATGAYHHDLSTVNTRPERHNPPFWRLEHHRQRNGNLYPTHPMGPIARALGLLETDTMTEIRSFSTAATDLPGAGPLRQGDVNTSLISTDAGREIRLEFGTRLPRKYARDFAVQGTHGRIDAERGHLSIGAHSHGADPRLWQAALDRYDSAYWHRFDETRDGTLWAHQGGDYLMLDALVQALHQGRPTDMDIHDGLSWSVIAPLSEASVAAGGRAQSFPDFTQGAWRGRGAVSLPALWQAGPAMGSET